METEALSPDKLTLEHYEEYLLKNPGYLVLGALYEAAPDKYPEIPPNLNSFETSQKYRSVEEISSEVEGMEVERVSEILETLTGFNLAWKSVGDDGPRYTITLEGVMFYRDLDETIQDTNQRLIELAKEEEDLQGKLKKISGVFDVFK